MKALLPCPFSRSFATAFLPLLFCNRHAMKNCETQSRYYEIPALGFLFYCGSHNVRSARVCQLDRSRVQWSCTSTLVASNQELFKMCVRDVLGEGG